MGFGSLATEVAKSNTTELLYIFKYTFKKHNICLSLRVDRDSLQKVIFSVLENAREHIQERYSNLFWTNVFKVFSI